VKKFSILIAMMLALLGLTGCVQETLNTVNKTKTKVEYATGILNEVVPLTTAYVGLQNLYLNPLSYASGNWKAEFDKHDDTIEASYERVKKLQPPQEFAESHALLVSALESTIKVNDLTEDTINAGGKISSELTKQFQAANQSFQTFKTQTEQLKSITQQ
jgi:hypothetical protein